MDGDYCALRCVVGGCPAGAKCIHNSGLSLDCLMKAIGQLEPFCSLCSRILRKAITANFQVGTPLACSFGKLLPLTSSQAHMTASSSDNFSVLANTSTKRHICPINAKSQDPETGPGIGRSVGPRKQSNHHAIRDKEPRQKINKQPKAPVLKLEKECFKCSVYACAWAWRLSPYP